MNIHRQTPTAGSLPVWGEDHSSSILDNTHDGVPQETSGERVHTCGGLILAHGNSSNQPINQLHRDL